MQNNITTQEAMRANGNAENTQDDKELIENTKSLFLEDDVFHEARQNFNITLQRLLKNMEDSKSAEGSITLKLDILIESESIPNTDPDIDAFERTVQIPTFSHKVYSQVTVKDEIKGRNNPNMELFWNEEMKCYELKYVADTAQKTIFDKDIMEQYNGVEDHDNYDDNDYVYDDPEE